MTSRKETNAERLQKLQKVQVHGSPLWQAEIAKVLQVGAPMMRAFVQATLSAGSLRVIGTGMLQQPTCLMKGPNCVVTPSKIAERQHERPEIPRGAPAARQTLPACLIAVLQRPNDYMRRWLCNVSLCVLPQRSAAVLKQPDQSRVNEQCPSRLQRLRCC